MRVLRQAPEQTDQQVALTIGNFDGVHIGHKAMLTRLIDAARQRGMPSVVMTSFFSCLGRSNALM